MESEKKILVTCEIEVTLHVIGGKYKPLIIYFLTRNGTKRFGQILEYMGPISQKTLTSQLRELERDGIVTRKIYAEVPPKVEYSVTEKGRSLYPILQAMCRWGWENAGDKYALITPQCSTSPKAKEHYR